MTVDEYLEPAAQRGNVDVRENPCGKGDVVSCAVGEKLIMKPQRSLPLRQRVERNRACLLAEKIRDQFSLFFRRETENPLGWLTHRLACSASKVLSSESRSFSESCSIAARNWGESGGVGKP